MAAEHAARDFRSTGGRWRAAGVSAEPGKGAKSIHRCYSLRQSASLPVDSRPDAPRFATAPMPAAMQKLRRFSQQYGASFSYVGLVLATLFFAASLTPSLLPRNFAVQGLLSGMALSVGYGVGVLLVLLWDYLELPRAGEKIAQIGKWVTGVSTALVMVTFLWRATVWQNSIRQLMELQPVETAYPWRVAAIALVTGALLVAAARLVGRIWQWVHDRINRVVPRRVSYVVSTIVVAICLLMIANKVFARLALNAADAIFLELDTAIDEGIEPPQDPRAAGSPESLIDWKTIGRQGRNFVVTGPTQESISEFWGGEAKRPLRVYVGMTSRETMQERAELALEELQRVGGFERSVLIVATPTGTGWLDPGAVDTVEYLHRGDTAIVSMQYSYLPSWITILVDPVRSRESARVLFDVIYSHWTSLPRESRPRLYLHGLSLGALGSESSADLFTVFEDPIQGGLWSGPPFPSRIWAQATAARNPDSLMWLPRFRDGSMVRFTTQQNSLDEAGERWGPMRFVYLQHASDPMTFFSPDLLYRSPQWLAGERGPDVSPYLRWYPIVTFLQIGFDLPMATSVPTGYGHNFAPEHYIEAWVGVTDPPAWSDSQTERLRQHFAD
jgi:uncharacterized membrane protein